MERLHIVTKANSGHDKLFLDNHFTYHFESWPFDFFIILNFIESYLLVISECVQARDLKLGQLIGDKLIKYSASCVISF